MIINLTEIWQMRDRIYIDTNIWVYLYSETEIKSAKASELINSDFNQIVISTQILNELFNVLAIKLKIKTKEETKEIINDLISSFEISVLTGELIIKAIDLSIKYQFRFYDSLMVSIALHQQCKIFYSEDLQNGQVIENKLTIINPFK